jgi:hypothetical protein
MWARAFHLMTFDLWAQLLQSTWAPIPPCRRRGRSVCDQALPEKGSSWNLCRKTIRVEFGRFHRFWHAPLFSFHTFLKSASNLKSLIWFWRNFLKFQAKSLWLRKKGRH